MLVEVKVISNELDVGVTGEVVNGTPFMLRVN